MCCWQYNLYNNMKVYLTELYEDVDFIKKRFIRGC